MKRMLSKCFNDNLYENEDKKVNYLNDIYQGPFIKNRLNNKKLKTTLPHLSQFELLCESTIGPNYYDKKINLHINSLKQKYQDDKDKELYMNKSSKVDSELKFDYTYKYLKQEVNDKFQNIKNFPDNYRYFMEKYFNYESKIKLLKKEFREKIAL